MSFKWAKIYVAMNQTRQQIAEAKLSRLIPTRIVKNNHKGGKPPTVLTIGVDEKGERNSWSWKHNPEG